MYGDGLVDDEGDAVVSRRRPGQVRDAIIDYLHTVPSATTLEIIAAVREQLGESVAASSVRSYLRLNTSSQFERLDRGRYALRARP